MRETSLIEASQMLFFGFSGENPEISAMSKRSINLTVARLDITCERSVTDPMSYNRTETKQKDREEENEEEKEPEEECGHLDES